MAENSKIEWTDHTFNPWRGCTKVHEGCANCYAEREAKRFPANRGIWGPNGTRVKASDDMWRQPLKWNRTAILSCLDCGSVATTEPAPKGSIPVEHPWDFECHCGCNRYVARRPRVFCASLADVFEDWHGPVLDHDGKKLWRRWDAKSGAIVADVRPSPRCSPLTLDDLRADLFALIDQTPWLDWLVLTKRPENVRRMWPVVLDASGPNGELQNTLEYRDNVWLGTSVSNQETYERYAQSLYDAAGGLTPVKFLSVEPLLGPIKLFLDFAECFQWVIVGGESGPGARPMHPDWARSLRDQCQAAGVPFFFKQWWEWKPTASASYALGSGLEDGTNRVSMLADGRVCLRDVGPAFPKQVIDSDALAAFNAESARWERLAKAGKHDPTWEHTTPLGYQWMARVGKHAAGRLLDGREWNEFPHVDLTERAER